MLDFSELIGLQSPTAERLDPETAMWSLVSKIAAVLVAITYLVIMIIDEHGVSRGVVGLAGVLSVPLALIWFPDEIGCFTGSVGRGGQIDAESPPALVSLMGWVFLVGPPLFYALLNAR
jgi:hypothetical protein